MSKTDVIVNEIEQMKDRYEELSEVKEQVEDVLDLIDQIESGLPDDIGGSHHADMEYNRTLQEIERAMQEIEDKL